MRKEDCVDFNWTDLLSASIDEFLESACDCEEPIGIYEPLIAGAEECSVERGRVRTGVAQVSFGNIVEPVVDVCDAALPATTASISHWK